MLFLLLLSASDPTSTDSLSLSEQLSGINKTFTGERGVREGVFRELFLRDSLTNGGKGISDLKSQYMAKAVGCVLQPKHPEGSLVDQIQDLTKSVAALREAVVAFMAKTKEYDTSEQIGRAQERAEKFNETLQNELGVARTILDIQQSIGMARNNHDWEIINQRLDAIKGTGQTSLTTDAITAANSLVVKGLLEVNQQEKEEFERQKALIDKAKREAQEALETNQRKLAASQARHANETAEQIKEKERVERELQAELVQIDKDLKRIEADALSWQRKTDQAEAKRRQVLIAQNEEKLKTAKIKLMDEATTLFGKGEETHRKIIKYSAEIDKFNRAFGLNQIDLTSKIKATIRMLSILNHIGETVIAKMEADFKADQKKAQQNQKTKKKGLLNHLFFEEEITASKKENGLLAHLIQGSDRTLDFFLKQPTTAKPEKAKTKEAQNAQAIKAKEDTAAWENERFERLLPKVSALINGAFETFSGRMLSKSEKLLKDDGKCKKCSNQELLASLRVTVAEINKIQNEINALKS